MAFVADSRYAGYLGPHDTPRPLESDAWEDLLHNMITGISGMPSDKVFPRWQPRPPVRPPIDVDWVAFGISEIHADWQAVTFHVTSSAEHPDGYDLFQHMEEVTLLASFYGPNATQNATFTRSGFFIDQNLAELRRVNVAFVEVQHFTNSPELFKQQWVDRIDMPVVLRREIRYNYPVLNLISSRGTIYANAPLGEERVVETDFDTTDTVLTGYPQSTQSKGK